MYHFLYCKFILIRRKIATHFFFTRLYESNVGVKYVMPIFNPTINGVSDVFLLQPNELFLDFDALKDKYTLCDVAVSESPHLGFLQCLNKGGNIKETEYIKRFEKGTIDIRVPYHVTSRDLWIFKNTFDSRKKEVESGQYEPVVVYLLGGKYYIADGKHRAAMCALLKQPVKCVLINNSYLEDSFYGWILKKMKKHPSLYKTNISFFEQL